MHHGMPRIFIGVIWWGIIRGTIARLCHTITDSKL